MNTEGRMPANSEEGPAAVLTQRQRLFVKLTAVATRDLAC